MSNNSTFASIKPKPGQEEYYEALKTKDIIFVSGNAGTGKTILAINQGLKCLFDNRNPIDRICIIRPYIFAQTGEKIGALPGTLDEKVAPFVHSIIDNLEELNLQKLEIDKLIQTKIEFLTLSTLRGRSLHNRFILVEEAQNVPIDGDSMLTILTRIGKNSKLVVAGDLSQCDITETNSGFLEAINALSSMKEIAYIEMNNVDYIYRNPLISKILKNFKYFRENHQ